MKPSLPQAMNEDGYGSFGKMVGRGCVPAIHLDTDLAGTQPRPTIGHNHTGSAKIDGTGNNHEE